MAWGMAVWLALAGAAMAAEVRVYAPGALAEVMEQIARAEGGPPAFTVVGGHSPAQARQIDEGAPADIFISADTRWMEFLRERGRLAAGSEAPLAVTRLVLVAPEGAAFAYGFAPGESLAAALGGGRLAIGDPDTVPAGRFARLALERLGAWEALAGHLALLPHVRGVMAMVGRGEAAAGIGYETDLGVSGGVRLVGVFPPGVVPPVVFPIAVVAGHESPEVEEACRRILGPGGRAVLRAHGFADPAP